MTTSKSRLHVVTSPEKERTEKSPSPATPAMLHENKSINVHKRSHAAHLNSGGAEHTKPAGNLRQGSYPIGRKQP